MDSTVHDPLELAKPKISLNQPQIASHSQENIASVTNA